MLDFDITGYKRSLHSYQDICKGLGIKHVLLVEVKDTLRLDCMGKILHIFDFCRKQPKKGNFLRGYINKKLHEGVCEYGKATHLSLACDKKDNKFCIDPKAGCEKLRRYYSSELQLDHHSLIEKDVDNILNCYYSKEEEIKVETSDSVLPFNEKEVIDRDLFSFEKVKKSSTKR